MTTDARRDLHRLVDKLPDGEIHTAQRFLEYLARVATTATTMEPEQAPGIEPPTADELRIQDAIGRAALASRLEIEERQATRDAETPGHPHEGRETP